MSSYQERVVEEKVELSAKIAKLNTFFESETFAGLDKPPAQLLLDQWEAMLAYEWALARRIRSFS